MVTTLRADALRGRLSSGLHGRRNTLVESPAVQRRRRDVRRHDLDDDPLCAWLVEILFLAAHSADHLLAQRAFRVVAELRVTADLDVARRDLRIDGAEGDLGVRYEIAVLQSRLQGAQPHVLTVPVEADRVGRDESIATADGAYHRHQCGLQDPDVAFGNRRLGQIGGGHVASVRAIGHAVYAPATPHRESERRRLRRCATDSLRRAGARRTWRVEASERYAYLPAMQVAWGP